jgi:hypothetical protein
VNNEKWGKSTFDFKEREGIPMVTEFQDNFRNRFDTSYIGKMDADLAKDLRSVHFDIKDDERFRGMSEYKEHYIKTHGDAIGQQTLSDNKLRRGNFNLGDLPGDYRTIYRDKFKYPPNQ